MLWKGKPPFPRNKSYTEPPRAAITNLSGLMDPWLAITVPEGVVERLQGGVGSGIDRQNMCGN